MNRKTLTFAIGFNTVALLALLGYSLERTAWLFQRFEVDAVLPVVAAVVVELAAVSLLVGAGAIAQLDKAARAWSNRALGAVLSVQALANLSAGYLRGGHATLALFQGESPNATYAVAAALWLSVNLAVPALIFFLSKLLERLIAARGAQRGEDLAQLQTLLDTATADLAQTREQYVQLQSAAAQPDPLLAQFQEDLAQNREILAQQSADLARAREQAAQQERAYVGELRTKERELAQLREQAAQPITFDGIDMLKVARRLRDSGVSSRETADLLCVKESTLRNRLKDLVLEEVS
jgi:hypothetical protein